MNGWLVIGVVLLGLGGWACAVGIVVLFMIGASPRRDADRPSVGADVGGEPPAASRN